MPQIIAWQCSQTKKVFTEKVDYTNYLRKLANERKRTKRYTDLKTNFYNWLETEKENICSVDEIAPWILLNQKKLMEASNAFNLGSFRDDKYFDDDEFTKIEIYSARYSESVSNTHSCPHNGVTNWRGDAKLPDGTPAPHGYPGWSADIKGTLVRNKKRMSSYPYDNIMKLIKLHTGTGGGGNEGWRYDCRLYLADWPGLSTQMLVNKLAGK